MVGDFHSANKERDMGDDRLRSIARAREIRLQQASETEKALNEIIASLRSGTDNPRDLAQCLETIKAPTVSAFQALAEAEYVSRRRKIALGLMEAFRDPAEEEDLRNMTADEVDALVDRHILQAVVAAE